MIEIIFNFIGLLGGLILLVVAWYQAMQHEKKMQERYFDKLEESISVGVFSALVRYENYKATMTEQVEIARLKL